MSDFRYCSYCDAYRERERCEACGWRTYSLKEPAPSSLPPEWRPQLPGSVATLVAATGRTGKFPGRKPPLRKNPNDR